MRSVRVNIAHALASEIVYMNDEALSWRCQEETPEARWVRMRAWVDAQIVRDEPESHPARLTDSE